MSEAASRNGLRERWRLFAVLAVAALLHLWGLGRDLPYTAEVDEPTFVSAAVQIVAIGNLNPHWFGHPGATLIYPLAAFYHTEQALAHGATLFRPMPELQARFAAEDPSLYFFGRLLTVAYALATIPLLYHLGVAAFDRRPVALLAAFLFTLYPFAALHARWIRTDSASVFFTVLALWFCLRLVKQRKLVHHVAAGAAIGLAVATKYYLLLLALVLVAAILLRKWQDETPGRKGATGPWRRATFLLAWAIPHLWQWQLLVGAAAVLLSFALASPYFFLDWPAVRANLIFESRSVHPGADGLSPPGNLAWYFSVALPAIITWPQVPLLAAGVALALRRRQPRPLLLLLFALPFLAGISLSPLHQQRWLLPVLPIFTLFTADCLWDMTVWIHQNWGELRGTLGNTSRNLGAAVVTGVILLLLTAVPAYQSLLLNVQLSRPSTRVLAGAWIQANLPAGSAIALEEYTAPSLLGSGYRTLRTFALGWGDATVTDYVAEGYRYLVVSDEMYNRFLSEPDRFPAAAAFYRQLFAQGRLLQEFRPSAVRGGPLIRIYEVDESAVTTFRFDLSALDVKVSAPSRAGFPGRASGLFQTGHKERPSSTPAPSP